MIQFKDRGIILKSKDFFEADRLLTIMLAEKGKVKAIAKGVRRSKARLGGSLELLTFVDLVLVEGKSLNIVTSANIIDSFKNIRKNLKKTSIAFYMAELVDKLIEEDEPHSDIFILLLKSFKRLNSDKKIDYELLISYFIINLLNFLGFKPEIVHCLSCQNKNGESEEYFFSPRLGGIICKNCHQKDSNPIPTSLETLKVIKLFQEYDIGIIEKIKPKNIHELIHILEQFLEYIFGREFKSEKFYKLVNIQKRK